MPSAPRDLGFSIRVTAGGSVRIARHGAHVATLDGAPARRFLARVRGLDDAALQAEAARATGNYARGNERTALAHPRNVRGKR
jgi:antitoxin (DNA-binding transcriptional repressor) of toxin-antitoxin stability system